MRVTPHPPLSSASENASSSFAPSSPLYRFRSAGEFTGDSASLRMMLEWRLHILPCRPETRSPRLTHPSRGPPASGRRRHFQRLVFSLPSCLATPISQSASPPRRAPPIPFLTSFHATPLSPRNVTFVVRAFNPCLVVSSLARCGSASSQLSRFCAFACPAASGRDSPWSKNPRAATPITLSTLISPLVSPVPAASPSAASAAVPSSRCHQHVSIHSFW